MITISVTIAIVLADLALMQQTSLYTWCRRYSIVLPLKQKTHYVEQRSLVEVLVDRLCNW
ncbi:hypothetical protein AAHE18_04G114300 [Arachis hypogaea]